jgi:hypothetical protein
MAMVLLEAKDIGNELAARLHESRDASIGKYQSCAQHEDQEQDTT